MTHTDELAKTLTELPRKEYAKLIKKVDAERRMAFEDQERDAPPRADMSEAEFAEWIGRQHFYVDKGICRVFYLPVGAPAGEVRLLEVNELAIIPEDAQIWAFDFLPEIDGINYSLLVADVTPRQLEGITKGLIPLPPGWTMEGAIEVVGMENE